MVFRSDDEKEIAEKAVLEYRKWQERCRDIKKLLDTKKFKYGTYVIRLTTNGMEHALQIPEIGKVIWYEEEQNYYRVRFDDSNAWVGMQEDKLELYEGRVPQELIDYDIQDSSYIKFGHDSKEWRKKQEARYQMEPTTSRWKRD